MVNNKEYRQHQSKFNDGSIFERFSLYEPNSTNDEDEYFEVEYSDCESMTGIESECFMDIEITNECYMDIEITTMLVSIQQMDLD